MFLFIKGAKVIQTNLALCEKRIILLNKLWTNWDHLKTWVYFPSLVTARRLKKTTEKQTCESINEPSKRSRTNPEHHLKLCRHCWCQLNYVFMIQESVETKCKNGLQCNALRWKSRVKKWVKKSVNYCLNTTLLLDIFTSNQILGIWTFTEGSICKTFYSTFHIYTSDSKITLS